MLNIALGSPFKSLVTSGNVSFSQSIVSIRNTTLEKIYKILTQPNLLLWETVNILYISAVTNHSPTMLYAVYLKHVFPGGRLCVDLVIEINPQGNVTDTCTYQIDNVNISYTDASLFLAIQPGQVRRTVSACSNYYLHAPWRLRKIVSNCNICNITKDLSLIAENKYYSSSHFVSTRVGFLSAWKN